MSWLTGIAGRAEALLDRMDQVTATSVQSTGITTPQRDASSSSSSVDSSKHYTSLTYEPTASTSTDTSQSLPHKSTATNSLRTMSLSYSPVSHPEAPPKTTPPPSSLKSYSKGRPIANDDTIFQFLNTPSKPTAPAAKKAQTQAKRRLSNPKTAQPNKALNSNESSCTPVTEEMEEVVREKEEVVSIRKEESGVRSKEEKEEETDGEKESGPPPPDQPHQEEDEDDEQKSNEDEVSINITPGDWGDGEEREGGVESGAGKGGGMQELIEEKEEEKEKEVTPPLVVQHQPIIGVSRNIEKSSGPPLDQHIVNLQRKVSDLELENKLLKREVTSLNDELGTVLERVREAEEGVASHRQEAESLREQVAMSDHVIRQLRSHDEDSQATLEARDSQIQVLRKELTEVEMREQRLKVKLEGEGKEKERLLQDASQSSEVTNQAMEVLKSRLQETEELLSQERETALRAKVEYAERESSLQSQQQQLLDSVESQRRQLALLQAKVGEGQRSVQAANKELSQTHREHEEYKKRAAGILQAKEKVIASLQEGGAGMSGSAQEATLQQMQLEKDALRAELEETRLQGGGLRAELHETEEQHSQEMAQLTQQIGELERELEEERKQSRTATGDLQKVSMEMEVTKEKWEREKQTLTSSIKERDNELVELKTKLPSVGHASSSSQQELETRLHDLTENLIQKQTTLETLSSDRNSLRLQLERTESQLAAARRAHPPAPHTAIKGLDSSSSNTDNHIRPMTSVLPLSGHTHSNGRLENVRKAMNSLDTFSVRLAVFLRRYPYARLFLIFYMVLLHVWVLVVLLTYTPEAHEPSDLAPHEP